jgi:hypothetical protein
MRWTLVCDGCARGEEIKTIGILRRAPTACGVCKEPLPLMSNGLSSGNPVGDDQLERLKLAHSARHAIE